MPVSVDKLLKFFQLEKEKNFQDRAVIGGLSKILGNWIFEARKDHLPDALIADVKTGLENYSAISPEARQVLLDELILEVKKFSPPSSQPQSKPLTPAPAQAPVKQHIPEHRPEVKPAFHPQAPRPQPAPKPAPATQREFIGLNAPLTVINGIGPAVSAAYKKIGLKTLSDLLYHFPRRYDDYSQLKPINRVEIGDELTIIASVQSLSVVTQSRNGMTRAEIVVSDGTDFMRLIFFRRGPQFARYFESKFGRGVQLVISGKVTAYLGRKQMLEPECELLEKTHLSTNGIIPVYPLTEGISQNSMRSKIYQVITYYAPKVPDFLPDEIRSSANLIELPIALKNIHYPMNHESLKSARERLAFDEIFLLQLGVLQQKQSWQALPAEKYAIDDTRLAEFVDRLPYKLTSAQQKVIAEIRHDLTSGHPMNRLLQGDVGSGKTVVAAIAILIISANGVQSAIMAPTSILAEQHYRSLSNLLACEGLDQPFLKKEEICLLTGDTPEAEKREIKNRLASGEIKLIIGTHALIEDNVAFKNLQLAVIDEQHRFGVAQRAALREKGSNPHLLVMSATPIPRSLALTLYGDLDLSVMDELPEGRQPVETYVLSPLERERAYQLIRSQLELGRQAFIVYPLIENSEESETKAAVSEHDQLQKEIFPQYKLGLLHGRMKPDEKDQVMLRFREKEFQILVSTTVIEVGVDVPNASIMLIEGAERFGLAQLHQLRGRVGRNSEQSYCLLIPSTDDATENERLAVMNETNDGFVLAEKDLAQRGPGDFIGYRQSGFSDLQLASITDVRLIEKARNQAEKLFEKDPDLSQPENQPLARKLAQFWQSIPSDMS